MKRVTNAGASGPRRSAFAKSARHGVVARRIVSIASPATGHSYSGRETMPEAASSAGGPLTVITCRRPIRHAERHAGGPQAAIGRVVVGGDDPVAAARSADDLAQRGMRAQGRDPVGSIASLSSTSTAEPGAFTGRAYAASETVSRRRRTASARLRSASTVASQPMQPSVIDTP